MSLRLFSKECGMTTEGSAFESTGKEKLEDDDEEEVKLPSAIFLKPYNHEDREDIARIEQNLNEEDHQVDFGPDIQIKEEIIPLSDTEIPDLEENQEASHGSPHCADDIHHNGHSNILLPGRCSEVLNEPVEYLASWNQNNLPALYNVQLCNTKQRINSDPIFKCPQCDYVTNKSYSLREHYHLHTGKTPYKCLSCNLAFPTNIHLHNHIQRSHAEEVLYKCLQCSYTTKCHQALTRHKNDVHTDVTHYKCSQCDFVTIHQNNLITHEVIHTEKKPHKCAQCNYAAFSLYKLIKHARTHTG